MSEQGVEVVKRAYAAFAKGDVPAVLGVFADDIEWHEAEGMPYGGVYRGGEAVVQNVFGPISQDVEGFALTPEEFMAAGDTVAVVVTYTGPSCARLGYPGRQGCALPSIRRHGEVRRRRARR